MLLIMIHPISLFSILVLSFPTLAADSPSILLPLPNTEYISKCTDGTYVTKSGILKKVNKGGKEHFSMTLEVKAPKGIQRSTLEPWSRMTLFSTALEAKDRSSQAKIVSGNLQNIALNVGTTYEGQISQDVVYQEKPLQIEWKANLTINSIQKVTYNNESLTAYKMTLRKSMITGKETVTAVLIYLPKIQQFYKSNVDMSDKKMSFECTLLSHKPIETIPPKDTKSK